MAYDSAYFTKAQEVIMDVLSKVRPELMEAFGSIAFTEKDDKSVVTELDNKVEGLLKDALRQFDPEVGFLGEEFGQEGSTEHYWLIDPIDGTESFIRGIPVCRNQLAFISNGQALYALCYVFPTEDIFVAEQGKGTTKNGEPVHIQKRPLNRAWFEISADLVDPTIYEAYKRLRPQIAGIAVTHSYTMPIEGMLDGSISSFNGGPWDYVPRALLAQEAGARIGNFGSLDYDLNTNSLVTAHPDNFETIQKLLSGKA